MQCKRRWQWGEEDSRGEGGPRLDGGSNCKEWAQQRAGRDVPCLDGTRGGDDNRRAKLTARPSGTCGGVKVGEGRPPDQSRLAALGGKQAMEVPARDRVRPGREAPGRLRRPVPLGRSCQEGSAVDPTREAPSRGYQSGRDQLTPRSHCCLEAEWTCRCCGTAWHKKVAKDE